jgi:hypothetical protein
VVHESEEGTYRLRPCPLIGEDRKSSAHGQNDAKDPKQTLAKSSVTNTGLNLQHSVEMKSIRHYMHFEWLAGHRQCDTLKTSKL